MKNIARSPYYGVKGIVDVISSVSMRNIPKDNLIMDYLLQNLDLIKYLKGLDSYEYEIIIDYKGMARPSTTDNSWKHHEWQILTYAWLRSKQPDAKKVIAGIIFYINELDPSGENLLDLKEQVKSNSTDVLPKGSDYESLWKWRYGNEVPKLSESLKEERFY